MCQWCIGSNGWKRGSLLKIADGLKASHGFGCSSSAPLPSLSKPAASAPGPALHWLCLCQQRALLLQHWPPQAGKLAEELKSALLPTLGLQLSATKRYTTGCFKFYRDVSGSVRQVSSASTTSIIAFTYYFLKGILNVGRTPTCEEVDLCENGLLRV